MIIKSHLCLIIKDSEDLMRLFLCSEILHSASVLIFSKYIRIHRYLNTYIHNKIKIFTLK